MKNAIKSVFVCVDEVCCDQCGRDLNKREFSFLNLACGDYVCRDCQSENEMVQSTQVYCVPSRFVLEKGGVA
jgi:uncharacterized protein (UPF0212 family)